MPHLDTSINNTHSGENRSGHTGLGTNFKTSLFVNTDQQRMKIYWLAQSNTITNADE